MRLWPDLAGRRLPNWVDVIAIGKAFKVVKWTCGHFSMTATYESAQVRGRQYIASFFVVFQRPLLLGRVNQAEIVDACVLA
jgi:hypothetical protein